LAVQKADLTAVTVMPCPRELGCASRKSLTIFIHSSRESGDLEMPYASNIHVAVYQVLDQVLAAPVAPPGAKATIHSIIDDLHAASVPRRMIEQAESISLQLHHLESAIVRGDSAGASEARQKLGAVAAAWLDNRITS
jgi:hypothetical protein